MNEAKFVISLDLKGKAELEKLIGEIGKEKNIPVNVDLSKAKVGALQELNKPFQNLVDKTRVFSSQAGIALFGIQKIYGVLKSTVGAMVGEAQNAESAGIALAGSLRATGLEVDSNVKALSDYASELQKLTVYEDDQIRLQMAQMQNIARFDNTETLKEATKAAIGLADAFGLDLSTAMDLVGKAAAGNTAMLGRYGIVLDENATQAEKFNQLLGIGANYFSISEEKANSSLGALQQLKNTWGDLQETLAMGVLPVIQTVANSLKWVMNAVTDNKTAVEAEQKAVTDERIEFERLIIVYKRLRDTQNRSKEENEQYAETIKKLQDNYGEHLKNLNLEKDSWQKVEEAILKTRKELDKYFMARIQYAMLEDKEKEIVKIAKKKLETQQELDLLQAQFNAGLIPKKVTQYTLPTAGQGPYSGEYNWVEVPSPEANREEILKKKLSRLKKEEEDLWEEAEKIRQYVEKTYGKLPEPKESGISGGGKKGKAEGGTSAKDSEREAALKEIEDFHRKLSVLFDEEQTEIKEIEDEYAEKLKLFKDGSKEQIDLQVVRDLKITEVEEKYREKEKEAEKQHYEDLKFYDTNYYAWKKKQLEEESKTLFKDTTGREQWLTDQIAKLNAEKNEWDQRKLNDFTEQYESEMKNLSELHELGIVTYEEIARKAWEYYEALVAICQADGELSEEEKNLITIFQKRAETAQKNVSNPTKYYEEMMFGDKEYYTWKRQQLEKEVAEMEISAEQKKKLLTKLLAELEAEYSAFGQKKLANRMMDAFGIQPATQQTVLSQYQILANQISSIWNQLYNNLAAEKENALNNAEDKAKKERKTDAWLAAEKDKINQEYEKKYRALKRTEKAMQIASATANTLEGITNALTIKPAILAPFVASAIGAFGFAQVALIAKQKFAKGGKFQGKGTTTSDSNLIAISDQEYIISAERVRLLGQPFFDALNFGNNDNLRAALAGLSVSLNNAFIPPKYASGGSVNSPSTVSMPLPPPSQNAVYNIKLVCEGKELAKAVLKSNKKIIST